MALDDFFTVHENGGRWVAAHAGTLPLHTDTADDFLVLAYGLLGLALLYVFRREVFERRNSSTLLMAGALAAVAMVTLDAYARPLGPLALRALEYPAQAFAVGLLLLAYLARLKEVLTSKQTISSGPRARKTPSSDRIDSGGIWTIPSPELVEAVIRGDPRRSLTETTSLGDAAEPEAEAERSSRQGARLTRSA